MTPILSVSPRFIPNTKFGESKIPRLDRFYKTCATLRCGLENTKFSAPADLISGPISYRLS